MAKVSAARFFGRETISMVEQFHVDTVFNVILFTDGTTGAGKGVMLTHANISCNAQQLRAWFPEMKDGKESLLAVFPFFHSIGWTGIQNLSILGGWTGFQKYMGGPLPAWMPAVGGAAALLLVIPAVIVASWVSR